MDQSTLGFDIGALHKSTYGIEQQQEELIKSLSPKGYYDDLLPNFSAYVTTASAYIADHGSFTRSEARYNKKIIERIEQIEPSSYDENNECWKAKLDKEREAKEKAEIKASELKADLDKLKETLMFLGEKSDENQLKKELKKPTNKEEEYYQSLRNRKRLTHQIDAVEKVVNKFFHDNELKVTEDVHKECVRKFPDLFTPTFSTFKRIWTEANKSGRTKNKIQRGL